MVKACKICHLITKDKGASACSNCKTNDFSTDYSGEVFIVNPAESEISKRMKIDKPGHYALRVR